MTAACPRYRAHSNRARRHPAEAISDLNSALFFDGDLSSRDRAKAILERKKAFRDAGLKPTALAAAQPIVPTPQEGGAGWGAATRSASPATPPKQNRIITASPRRVLEPIKVNRPRSVASAWPAHSPILPPASDQAAQGPAKARSIPTFQTRVAARTVPERSYSTPSTSQRSYLKPTVERGVGQVSGATGRKAVQAPVKAATPWQVSSTQPQQRGPSGWPASIQQQSAPERATEQPAPVRPAGEPTQSVGGAIGSATAGLGRFFANLVSPTAGAGNAVTRMAGSQENAADDDVAATPRVRTARVNGDAQAPRVPPPSW